MAVYAIVRKAMDRRRKGATRASALSAYPRAYSELAWAYLVSKKKWHCRILDSRTPTKTNTHTCTHAHTHAGVAGPSLISRSNRFRFSHSGDGETEPREVRAELWNLRGVHVMEPEERDRVHGPLDLVLVRLTRKTGRGGLWGGVVSGEAWRLAVLGTHGLCERATKKRVVEWGSCVGARASPCTRGT